MRLSIIIPVYNVEKYISDCLDSCLKQDISSDDYEIICVDDSSTDGSYSILLKYTQKYDNIVVLHHDVNRGVSAARNTGMEYMRGDYCWFIDSDDFIADYCFSKIIKQIDNSNCDILNVGMSRFKNEDNMPRSYYLDKVNYIGISKLGYVCTRIYKASLLTGLHFQTNIAYGEDEVFFFEIMRRKPIIEPFDFPVYFYRFHSEQTTNLVNDNKRCKRIADMDTSIVYLVDKYSYSDADVKKFVDQRVWQVADACSEISGIGHYILEIYKLKKIIHTIGIGVNQKTIRNAYMAPRIERIRKSCLIRTVYHFLRPIYHLFIPKRT